MRWSVNSLTVWRHLTSRNQHWVTVVVWGYVWGSLSLVTEGMEFAFVVQVEDNLWQIKNLILFQWYLKIKMTEIQTWTFIYSLINLVCCTQFTVWKVQLILAWLPSAVFRATGMLASRSHMTGSSVPFTTVWHEEDIANITLIHTQRYVRSTFRCSTAWMQQICLQSDLTDRLERVSVNRPDCVAGRASLLFLTFWL